MGFSVPTGPAIIGPEYENIGPDIGHNLGYSHFLEPTGPAIYDPISKIEGYWIMAIFQAFKLWKEILTKPALLVDHAFMHSDSRILAIILDSSCMIMQLGTLINPSSLMHNHAV